MVYYFQKKLNLPTVILMVKLMDYKLYQKAYHQHSVLNTYDIGSQIVSAQNCFSYTMICH